MTDTVQLRKTILSVLILTGLCFCVYGNTLKMGFVWDDLVGISKNLLITEKGTVSKIFTTDLWAGVGLGHKSSYYRPLAVLLTKVDYLAWGTGPAGYHLTNLLLHCLVTISVFLLSLNLIDCFKSAFIVAALFAVHPAHAEAVAWIGARTDLLPTLFVILGLYFHTRYRKSDSLPLLVAATCSGAFALLSKEMAITFPVLVYLVDWYLGIQPDKRLKAALLYGICLILPYFAVRSLILASLDVSTQPFLWRFYSAIYFYAKYIQNLFFPFYLKVVYDLSGRTKFFSSAVLLSFLMLILLLYGAYWFRKVDKGVSFGILFILVSILPVSGLPKIIQPFPIADRYLYLPSFGFVFIAGVVFNLLARAYSLTTPEAGGGGTVCRRGVLLDMGIIAVLLILGVTSFIRAENWDNDQVFSMRVIRDAPSHSLGYANLGVIMLDQNRLKQAESLLEIARKYNRGIAVHVISYNLGKVYEKMGDNDAAIKNYQRAIQELPDFKIAINTLGKLYQNIYRYDEAELQFKKLAMLEPFKAQPHYDLGIIYLKQERLQEAFDQFTLAVNYDPKFAAAHNNLGTLYARRGQFELALQHFKEAVKQAPEEKSYRNNLEMALIESQKVVKRQ